MMQVELFKVNVDDKTYTIKQIQSEKYFSESNFKFFVSENEQWIELKTNANNELVRDLCVIMGIDPVKELRTIMIEEISNELMDMNNAIPNHS
jgi:hypothetical protein